MQRADFHVSSPEGVNVTISTVAQSSDLWHRCLNALWDDGVMATLSDRAFRVLGALLRLRRDDGTARAPLAALCRLTGYRTERNVRYGLDELLAHRGRLLAAKGRDLFEVLPGWNFAGRKPGEAPDVGGRMRERSHFGTFAPENVRERSQKGTCAHPNSVSEFKTEDKNNNNPEGEAAVVVRVLLEAGIGFKQMEAAALAALRDVDRTMATNAVAGARRLRREGKLRVSKERDADACMRAWICSALSKRWALFDQASADKHATETRAARTPALIEELKAKVATAWRRDPDDLSFDEQTWALQLLGGWEGAIAALEAGLPPWRKPWSSPDRVREVLIAKAEEKAAARTRTGARS